MLGRSLNTPQRPPLNPLANNAPGLPLNTMKVPDTSPAARPPISVASSTIQPPTLTNAQHTICKRHSPEISGGVVENENAPFSLQHKRQRTKSGSDSMEPLVPSQDNNSAIPPSDCNSGLKGEAMPLCEHNARTTRLEGQELGPQNLEPSCSCTKRDLSSGSSSSNSNNNGNCSNLLIGESMKSDSDCVNDIDLIQHRISNGVHGVAILKGEGNNGGLSPHCAATLEYVTQLPEGCCGVGGGGPGILAQPPTLGDEGEDLEDDDNYLDSSEEEVEDEFTIINNEDEESCGEDDQSVISCVTVGSTCSLRSVASEALHTICINENGLAANEDGSLLYADTPAPTPLPSFSPSLFSHVPPAINFCQYNEKTQELPLAIGRQLKWRFTNITPLIVKRTVANSGYKITKKTLQWCGTWGKHMKSPCFKTVREFQKMNHFPGTFQIGRKDKLWKNFARLQAKFGKEEFGFIPKTFVLPGDLKALKAAFDKEGVKKKWIVKPPASARGTGIQVVHKWSQVPTDSSVVVQRYISRPYLINDTKFDMRIYVLITSFHPLRIYLYQDGLVRFASVQYNKASTSLGDRFMHLTNYSINKTSSSYTHNVDAGQCQGHKWTLKSLWGYLKARGVDTSALWSRVADLVIKTVISGESDIVVRTRRNVRSRYSCYELFGFDVILDERLRPWLLEVNISPSLHSASPLDHSVKGPLIADLLNIAAFHIPDKLSQQEQTSLLGDFSLGEKVSGLCLDRRLYTRLLTAEEQSKHVIVNGQTRTEYLSSVLDSLTPDDVRHLLTSEDEMHRAGKFTRIFPTSETHQYFGFMEKPRYYNRLMDAWENTYSNSRDIAVERLESLCVEKYHLRVPQTFKMPKVTVSGGFRVTPRQPSSLQLGKSAYPATLHSQSQPSQLNPSQSQPSQSSSSQSNPSQSQLSHSNLSLSQFSPGQQRARRRSALGYRRSRKPRRVVSALRPIVLSSYLLVRGLSTGLTPQEEEEEEEEIMMTEEREETDKGGGEGDKVEKEGDQKVGEDHSKVVKEGDKIGEGGDKKNVGEEQEKAGKDGNKVKEESGKVAMKGDEKVMEEEDMTVMDEDKIVKEGDGKMEKKDLEVREKVEEEDGKMEEKDLEVREKVKNQMEEEQEEDKKIKEQEEGDAKAENKREEDKYLEVNKGDEEEKDKVIENEDKVMEKMEEEDNKNKSAEKEDEAKPNVSDSEVKLVKELANERDKFNKQLNWKRQNTVEMKSIDEEVANKEDDETEEKKSDKEKMDETSERQEEERESDKSGDEKNQKKKMEETSEMDTGSDRGEWECKGEDVVKIQEGEAREQIEHLKICDGK